MGLFEWVGGGMGLGGGSQTDAREGKKMEPGWVGFVDGFVMDWVGHNCYLLHCTVLYCDVQTIRFAFKKRGWLV